YYFIKSLQVRRGNPFYGERKSVDLERLTQRAEDRNFTPIHLTHRESGACAPPDESLLLQSVQCLSNRRPTNTQLTSEETIRQLLGRSELPRDNTITQVLIDSYASHASGLLWQDLQRSDGASAFHRFLLKNHMRLHMVSKISIATM